MSTQILTYIQNKVLFLFPIIFFPTLIILAFFPAIDNMFVNWDDQYYVLNNPLINNPSFFTLKELLYKVISLNYHPLTMLSLWMNAMISGVTSASPFIITNIIFHCINTLLVWLLFHRLSNKSWLISFLTALIFSVHPMHVESVVWVSERKDVLYSFFFLLSIIAYSDYIKKKSRISLALSFLLFVMSCLSKAMAVSLVPCLFLIDYLKCRDFKKLQIYLEKTLFIFIAFIVGLIAIDVQGGGNFFNLLTLSESKNSIGTNNYSFIKKLINSNFANLFYSKSFFFQIVNLPFIHIV